jgi:hypothetical protein
MFNKDKQPIQQLVIASMLTIVQVTTSLPTYVPKHFDHQPLNGRQPKDSPRGSSLRKDFPKEQTFNPHVGSFK